MTAGEREPLTDVSGRTLATFLRGTRDELPLADDLQPAAGVSAELIADAVERELPGHIVGAPRKLGELLVVRGATPRRRSTLMDWDRSLPRSPAPAVPDGVTIGPAAGCSADELMDAYIDAYPPDHPDCHAGLDRDGQREMLRTLMDGEVIGPLLGCSRVARTAAGCLGAVLVNDPQGEPPLGVPWVSELFRHPDAPQGTGAALLAAALEQARADELPLVGLRVSDGNPARALYDRLGFRARQEVVTVLLAAGD
jgi:GNAT superfamily N-acetyltransferase